MNRRRFLSSLVTAAAALTLDPEELLWSPSARTIFIPPGPKIADLAFAKDAFNMRFIRQFDLVQDSAWLNRMDVLYGFGEIQWRRSDLEARVSANPWLPLPVMDGKPRSH